VAVRTETQPGRAARRRAQPGEPGAATRARPARVAPGAPGGPGGPAAPGRPGVPGRAAPPGRRAAPGGPAAPGRGTGAAPRRAAAPRPAGPAAAGGPAAAIARTPFILLVVGLLGGGLVCLLVINTVLASGSYQISSLQQAQAARQQQVQALQQQIATDSAPAVIARRARQLGMVAPPLTSFLNLRTGQVVSQPTTEPGVPAVPGYVP
jgi:hypothetical protein